MLDKFLPGYLKDAVTITAPNGTSRSSVINSATSGRIYRQSVPEGSSYPYIVVGEGHNIDFGNATPNNLLREIGCYNIVVVGRTLVSIDQIYKDIVDLLKSTRNQYIPSVLASPKLWVQAIILENSYQFEDKPLDGSQTTMVGYVVEIKGAYNE